MTTTHSATCEPVTSCPKCRAAGTLPGPAICDGCLGSGRAVVHASTCACLDCDRDVFCAPPEARIRLSALDYLAVDCPQSAEEREAEERRREIGDECAEDYRREHGVEVYP